MCEGDGARKRRGEGNKANACGMRWKRMEFARTFGLLEVIDARKMSSACSPPAFVWQLAAHTCNKYTT